MPDATKGSLVLIHQIILSSEERTENIPECTKAVPYEVWIKGFLLNESASLGEIVQIETFIGRKLEGIFVECNPSYTHGFGTTPLPLIKAGFDAKKRLEQEEFRGT